MADGRITSATIIGNGPGFDNLRGRLTRLATRSFGVHLNATQFQPLTRNGGLKTLLDSNKEMSRLSRPIGLRRDLLQALYEEFCAQVECAGQLGIPLSHLDSHHHVHTQAALFPVLKAVQRKFRIRKVRISKNVYLPGHAPSVLLLMKKHLYNWSIRRLYATATTDAFTEFDTFHALLSSGGLPSVNSLEAMVHPGSPRYEAETALLRSDWMRHLPASTVLISYDELN